MEKDLSPAAKLGSLSWEKRKKGKSKKEISEMMQKVSRARFDKQDETTSNA